MPVFEKPLSELYEYTGRNPCPEDFDEYWDAALQEMGALDPEIELRPAEFSAPFAECFDLFFTGVNGSRVHAKYLRPKNGSAPHPAVLQFHGYSQNCGDWSEKLNYAGLGFSIAALDCRGQGGLSEDRSSVCGTTFHGHIIRGLDDPDPRKLAFRQIFLDAAQLASIVMGFDEVDAGRVGASGGSQGGALAIACAALCPQIKRISPAFPFLSDYLRVWEMDLARGPYEELVRYLRQFDPRHQRARQVFEKLGYIDIQHLAKRVRADLLVGVGLMDQVCPPSTQFAAYNKMRCRKELMIYPDYGHEWLPGFNDASFQFMAGL